MTDSRVAAERIILDAQEIQHISFSDAVVVARRVLELEAEVERLRGIERRARSATDFLYEHGWQKIMAGGAINDGMFNRLFLLRDALSETPTHQHGDGDA